MAISQYWVGQKPARPLSITVRDSQGRPVDLTAYTDFKVRMVGSNNERLDLGNGVLETAGLRTGRFLFVWPKDKTLFTRPGEYVLQLEMSGTGKRDFTTTHVIRVRELGGK